MEIERFMLWDGKNRKAVAVEARKVGQEWMGLCPMHEDTKPSLSINPEKKVYNCFGCGWHGKFYDPDYKYKKNEKKIEKTYDYRDESGKLLYRVVRYNHPKGFSQRRPNGNGGWIGNLIGVGRVLFRLPELIKSSDTVFIPEGEKDVLNLNKLGLTATCNPMGAGKWRDEYNEYLRGRDVVLMPDNDKEGFDHCKKIGIALQGIAKSIKWLALPGLKEKEDISDWMARGGTKDQFMELAEKAALFNDDTIHNEEIKKEGNSIADEEWPEPIPLTEYSSLPQFPIEALPSPGREMIQMVGEINQVDPGMPASLFLSILSMVSAKKGIVNLETHKEQINLYICVIAESGERKSGTFGVLKEPIIEYQDHLKKISAVEISRAMRRKKLWKKEINHLNGRIIKSSDDEEKSELKRRLSEIENEMAENPIPLQPTLIIDDCTTEALGVKMTENGEKMALLSTEGGIFSIMAGLYSERSFNIDLYLKAYTGDAWSCERIMRGSLYMKSPTLTIGITVQPLVILTIGQNEIFKGRGLLARFLYCRTDPKAGYRMRQKKQIPESLKEAYENHILRLMEMDLDSFPLELTGEAHKCWDEFYNEVEVLMRPDKELELLKDWGSKLPGAVARIAGLFHFAKHIEEAPKKQITAETMREAMSLGRYYLEHARYVFGLMNQDPGVTAARKILEYVKEHKPESFKGRDIMRHKNYFKNMDMIEPGLKILCERGYLRAINECIYGRGRPESLTYKVNPKFNFNEKH